MAGLEAQLDRQVLGYTAQTFVADTNKTYIVPISTNILPSAFTWDNNQCRAAPAVLCRYTAHLAQTLKYNSIKQYLNIITILHKEYGYSIQPKDYWAAQLTLCSISGKRAILCPKKLLITRDLLLRIRGLVNLDLVDDANFWAASLVAFFGLLRKANLLPNSATTFSQDKHLTWSHFAPHSWGLAAKLTHAKNNQFHSREVVLALPSILGRKLCPVTAVLQAFILTQTAPFTGPPFARSSPNGPQPITASFFSQRLSMLMGQLGLPVAQYSGHSFPRGGVTSALACGIPAEVIQILGYWTSACFMEYLHCPLSSRLQYIQQFAVCLPQQAP